MSASRPRLAMHWQITLSLLLAIPTIFVLKLLQSQAPDWSGTAYAIQGIGIVGKLFLKLLKMIIMPLILASVVMSIAGFGGGTDKLKRLGGRTLLYYAVTTTLAVLMGVILVNLFSPGEGFCPVALVDGVCPTEVESAAMAPDEGKRKSVEQIILALVSDNIFGALSNNSAIMSVIVFALLVGVAIAVVGERAVGLRAMFEGLNEVMMKITEWVMLLAPIGIWALVVMAIMPVGWSVISPLFLYMITVLTGLLVHGAVTLPVIYYAFTRRNPLVYFRVMSAALLTAVTTASSAATLPLTMRCAERRGGVAPRVSRFVLPLGATVNMDGTALYESVAAIFIAQAYGIHLGLEDQILVFVTATLAAIGAAGVPSAGLVTLLIVLEAVDLPPEGYGLIVVVDRLLDMCRTTVNVWGDACGAAILANGEDALAPEDLSADIMAEVKAEPAAAPG